MSDYEKGIEAIRKVLLSKPANVSYDGYSSGSRAKPEELADAFLTEQPWGWYCPKHHSLGSTDSHCDTGLTDCKMVNAHIVVLP